MPKSLALSIYVLFTSLMQLVNGAKFLIIVFLLLAAVAATVIIALRSIYASF